MYNVGMHTYTVMLASALTLTVATAQALAQVPTTASSGPSSFSTVAPGGGPFAAGPGPFTAVGSTYAPRYGQPADLPPRPFGFGYTDSFLPSGLMFLIPAPTHGTPADRAAVNRVGALSLRVRPAHAQVFVDGAYAGTAVDFAGRGRALEEGPHRVEIRAEGYETHAFDRRIAADDTSTYRYDLWEVRAPASPNARLLDTVAVRTPFYIIAGCYAGNRPPTASQLPAGCNVNNVRTVDYMVRVPAR